MSVELDLTDEQATFLWCRMQRGRDGMAGVLEAHRTGAITDKSQLHAALAAIDYYFGALDCDLQTLARAAPEELRPDGNESDKP